MSTLRDTLAVSCCIGAAVMGGFYGTFSALIMPALKTLPPAEGIASMQAVNLAAPIPWSLVGLLFTGGASVGLAAIAIGRRGDVAPGWEIVGAALYLSSVVLTAAYHIPRNNQLAAVDPADPVAHALWATYLTAWTNANHVRLAGCLAAAVAFAVAALHR